MSVQVILGGMFSGKSTELIRRVKRYKLANKNVIVFKHSLDCKRNNKQDVETHDKNSIEAIAIKDIKEIFDYIKVNDIDVIAIDEAQFFDELIVHFTKSMSVQCKTVILAGLDMDYKGNSFGSIGELCCIADEILKLHAICKQCGKDAKYSYRMSQSKSIVKVGGGDKYIALCEDCYRKLMN